MDIAQATLAVLAIVAVSIATCIFFIQKLGSADSRDLQDHQRRRGRLPRYGSSSLRPGPHQQYPHGSVATDEALGDLPFHESTAISSHHDTPLGYLQTQAYQLTTRGYHCDIVHIVESDTMCVIVDLTTAGFRFDEYGQVHNRPEHRLRVYLEYEPQNLFSGSPAVRAEIERDHSCWTEVDVPDLATTGRSMSEIVEHVKRSVVA